MIPFCLIVYILGSILETISGASGSLGPKKLFQVTWAVLKSSEEGLDGNSLLLYRLLLSIPCGARVTFVMNCKGNPKYRVPGTSNFLDKSRLGQNDIKSWSGMIGEESVIPFTEWNMLVIFGISKPGETISFLDATNTGGQYLRSLICLAAIDSEKILLRNKILKECRTSGQASTLLLQLWMFGIRPGQQIAVSGGNRRNKDAPSPGSLQNVLVKLAEIGIHFQLSEEEEEICLTRTEDTSPSDIVTFGEALPEHEADFLLMASMITGKSRFHFQTRIKEGEYHVLALVSLMREFGRAVKCEEEEGIHTISME